MLERRATARPRNFRRAPTNMHRVAARPTPSASPLYVNPVSERYHRHKDQPKARAEPRGTVWRKPKRKAMSQACPGRDPGNRNSIQGRVPGQVSTTWRSPGFRDTVYAAVASRKFTFLSGEICSTGIRLVSLLSGSLTDAHVERHGKATGPYRTAGERLLEQSLR